MPSSISFPAISENLRKNQTSLESRDVSPCLFSPNTIMHDIHNLDLQLMDAGRSRNFYQSTAAMSLSGLTTTLEAICDLRDEETEISPCEFRFARDHSRSPSSVIYHSRSEVGTPSEVRPNPPKGRLHSTRMKGQSSIADLSSEASGIGTSKALLAEGALFPLYPSFQVFTHLQSPIHTP